MKLREEEFYEQYHQHGGTTIIPTEIFNELYDDATEEIERLNSIIKEVREYINKISSEPNVFGHYAIDGDCKKWLLKILDKENNND